MREIKFKIWSKLTNLMSPVMDIKTLCYSSFSVELDPMSEKYVTFLQYTGIKDKNGKEIYEGDILDIDGANGKVEWYSGAWTVAYFDEPKCSYPSIFNETDIEIIGNIYENPELLK